MRTKAFTLVEILAVITLIGLMIGATTLVFDGFVQSNTRETAIRQIVRADQMMRLACRRMATPRSLQFDIPNQILREISDAPRETHLSGCRVDRVIIHSRNADSSMIPCSSAGLSPSYAVRLQGKDFTGWLVFSGLTGQTTWIEHEHDAKNLLEILSSRNDAR